MFVEMFDTFRKATEAAVQMQQEMVKPWLANGPAARAVATLPTAEALPEAVEGMVEQVQGFQKEWAGAMTDLLEKQRELVDAQFELGIQVWKDAVQVALARDPEQFRKSTETFWKASVEGVVGLARTQNGEYQELAEKFTALLNKPMAESVAPAPSRPRKRA